MLQVILTGLGYNRICRVRKKLTGRDLFKFVSTMTRINPDVLRIIIGNKEIYPNREILNGMKKDCLINLKLRLLGGSQVKKR